MGRQPVEHHVARAGIEGEGWAWVAARGEDGHVGDTAEVEHDPCRVRVSKEQIVDVAHQRRAVPTGRHVAHAKVSHRGDARPLGNHRRLTDLQRASNLAGPAGWWTVPDGLAMRADQVDGFR